MKDEHLLESRVGYELKRVQHALRMGMDEALGEVGMTTPQYAAMSALEEEPGLSGARLARRCFVTPQTMNQILAKLESAGFVERRAHPEHGRILQAYLTERSKGPLLEAHRAVGAVEKRMLAGWDEEERLALLDVLRRCRESLEGGS